MEKPAVENPAVENPTTENPTSGATLDQAAKVGVLLIGHGTRDETGTAQFFQLGERLSEQLSPVPVVPCLLEFQSPTIPEAWDQLVAQGVQHIHVAPLLLFAAGHAKQDVPELIGQCQSKAPHITVSQTSSLSRHPSIVELILQRISETAIDSTSVTALVMVGRGSHDPCAQADMRVLTGILSRRFDFAHVVTAFYAMAEPKLPDVLDQVAAIDGIRHVIVQPHLLFEGRLFQAIERQVGEASERSPEVRFLTAGYLGPVANVATAIADRILEQA